MIKMFNRTPYRVGQKIYIIGLAEYGRVEKIMGNKVQVLSFKSNHKRWYELHQIENGE